MRVVVALGGNALLKRGEPVGIAQQRRNARGAARAIAPLLREHETVVTHGNGPQVGLLALQSQAAGAAYPLDVLGAESEGLIGYLLVQEVGNCLAPGRRCAALLTQVEVDPADPAFENPTKFIGAGYAQAVGRELAARHGWTMRPDGERLRRVVPSPRPQRIVELPVIEELLGAGVVLICVGGGGVPVVRSADGHLAGVEAVIDKDLASGLLASEIGARALLLLTDVEAVWQDYGSAGARAIRDGSPDALAGLPLPDGSMGPKVQAACRFVQAGGGFAGIGRLEDAAAILRGAAGTSVRSDAGDLRFWEGR